jgi:hypothetical protein
MKKKTKKKKLVVQAGAQLDSWGTPLEVLDLTRQVLGSINLDLASNPEANKIVRARKFYTLQNPCPSAVRLRCTSVIWCNPPGPVEMVRLFWERWLTLMEDGHEGGFLIFNLDHWRTLKAPATPLYVCLWPKRLKFVGAPSQYNHPSALVLSKHPGYTFKGKVVRWGV